MPTKEKKERDRRDGEKKYNNNNETSKTKWSKTTGTKTITCYMASQCLALHPHSPSLSSHPSLPLSLAPWLFLHIFVVNVSVCHNNFAPVNKFWQKRRNNKKQNREKRIRWERCWACTTCRYPRKCKCKYQQESKLICSLSIPSAACRVCK